VIRSCRWAPVAFALCVSAGMSGADRTALIPQVREIVEGVSEARMLAVIEKLVGFENRNTMSSQDDPARGIGAARQWIFDQFKSYSPRLQVRYDKWRLKAQGQRIYKDVDLYNVVAVLPGKTMPETQVWITAHYDTINMTTSGQSAYERGAALAAPGACDDGSGIAAVMELARVMSKYDFAKTIVFVAFAGEEQGLFGSSLESAKAKKEDAAIEAVFNNDIIGTDRADNGRAGNGSINVYTDEVTESPSQQLGRFIAGVGQRYVPSMKVEMQFMQDRQGRGGDHTPFQLEGFAAVRFTTPMESYANQHTVTDTLANMSVPYAASVARVNAAALATLALAPKTPLTTAAPRGASSQAGSSLLSRGESRYDATLRWRYAGTEDSVAGYVVVMRSTLSPFWDREFFVGKVNEFTLKDVSIDSARFGVKAIAADGSESLVAPYLNPVSRKSVIEVVE
jgi:hypothetical protein